ncbi:protein of unknown function DUF1428 [Vibrio maritimus]|uniref:RNA signal recognition particle 4.5S RNA n=1 Tax=Vibrio maritimus TaxID=990268 RepID=A0A090RSD7_9VIBR|nr:protein of unknown function DUF1428 [Vibrio maritimus]
MEYVDGFVAAVPKENKALYREHVLKIAPVFKQHGALSVIECWEDDVSEGQLTSFPQAVMKKEDECVVFSWITWPSKDVRDAGMKAVFDDEMIQLEMAAMPFDTKRLIYGGFKVLVDE